MSGGVAVLAGLYLASDYNYLLFHSLAELFSIAIACGIFMVSWNSRRILQNNYVLLIGIAYLFVAGLDLTHTMAYKGMNFFPGYGANLATQLWTSARYMESISLLAAPFFIGRRLDANRTLAVYAAAFAVLLVAVFGGIFPDCFVEGAGLTFFKKVSEYVISLILVASMYMLHKRRNAFDSGVLRLLYASILLTVASDMAFTFYVSAYGFSNLVGHYLKLVSFVLIYRAVVVTGLREPYNLLYTDLKESEAKYHSLFTEMLNGFAYHKMVTDKNGKPVDYVFLEVNDAFERLTGLSRERVIGKKVTEAIPGIEKDPADWIGLYGKVALDGEEARFEQYSKDLGRWYSVSAYSPQRGYFSIVFEEISERKRAEMKLQKENLEIALANRILGVFVEETGEDMYDKALNIMLEGMQSRHGVFGYIDENGVLVCPSMTKLLEQCEIEGKCIHYPPEKWKGLWAHALIEKRALYTNTPPRVPPGHAQIWNNLAVPILFRGSVIGLFNLANKETGYTDEDRELMEGVAGRVAPVLYAWIQKEMRENERKRAEEALLESDERMNRAQEISNLGSWELDLTNNRLTWSDEVYRIFGLRPQEFGASYEAFLDAVHPDDRSAVDAAYSGSLREGKDIYEIVHRIVRKESGEVRHVHEKCEHIKDQSGRIIRSVGMVHDITERKRAEEELRRYREHLEELVWERTKELQAVNSLLELASRTSSKNEYLEEVAKLLQRWSGCRCVGVRVLDSGGNIPYAAHLGFSQEFWESENYLVLSRDHCACTRVVEGRPEPQDAPVMTHFGSFRSDNIVEFVAGLSEGEKSRFRSICLETGFRSVAIIPIRYEGRTIAAVHLADEEEGKVPPATVEFVENLTPLIGEAIRKLDLEQRLRENYAELMSTNEELEREMAERAKAEAQLLQSQKMEAVGQLAGGIAHDFNNRLFAIKNYAHILMTKAGDGSEFEILEKILVSCDKAAKLVDDLLKFSRKKEINPRPTDLNNVVKEAESLLKLAAGKSIEAEFELSDRPLLVMVDSTQMEHVLLNLVTNARDAMVEGGKLTIRTATSETSGVAGDMLSGGHAGPFATISVSDTGPGLDDSIKGKIFEPFFTTKEVGKGTGLGLSTVYGVVRQHSGYVDVESEPGKGATFRIYLPLI